jgi:hypothetical protein
VDAICPKHRHIDGYFIRVALAAAFVEHTCSSRLISTASSETFDDENMFLAHPAQVFSITLMLNIRPQTLAVIDHRSQQLAHSVQQTIDLILIVLLLNKVNVARSLRSRRTTSVKKFCKM